MLVRTVNIEDHFALLDASGAVLGEILFDIRDHTRLQLILNFQPSVKILVLDKRQVCDPDRPLRPKVVLVPKIVPKEIAHVG